MTDIVRVLRLVETPLCQEAADMIERLRETTVLQAAAQNLLSEEILTRGKQIARLTRERDAAVAALEIIAGKRQCVDNLMSNVEIALCALEQTAPAPFYECPDCGADIALGLGHAAGCARL